MKPCAQSLKKLLSLETKLICGGNFKVQKFIYSALKIALAYNQLVMECRLTMILAVFMHKSLRCITSETLVNLRNRTGEERRQQTLCDKHDHILFEKLSAKLHFPLNRSFCERPENVNVKWRSQQTGNYLQACHVCHTQTFCRPLLPAILLHNF